MSSLDSKQSANVSSYQSGNSTYSRVYSFANNSIRLQAIDPELAKASLRADMEKKISMIASGKIHFEDVLREELVTFRKRFKEFTEKIEKMDQLFEVTFSPLDSSGKPFSKCGKCRRYMHYIPLR